MIEAAPVTARLIDGREIAKTIEAEVIDSIARLGFAPGLVAVRVGNDPASEIYLRRKSDGPPLGLENLERNDMTLPRLGLCQSLTPQRIKSDPKYIAGLEEGESRRAEVPGGLRPRLCRSAIERSLAKGGRQRVDAENAAKVQKPDG